MTDDTITYDSTTDRIIFVTPRHSDLMSAVRSIPMGRYNPQYSHYDLPGIFAFYVAKRFSDVTQTAAFREHLAALTARSDRRKASYDTTFNAVDFSKPFGTRVLFRHQVEGVSHILQHQRSIVAADLGTGKTSMALAAMHLSRLPIHVIAPVSLHATWQREAAVLRVAIDRLMSASNIPDPLEASVALIVDEAHYFQNDKAVRTKRFLAYAATAEYLALVTGTPIKNGRPANLYPLLVAIHHPIAVDREYFYKRYCDATRDRWGKLTAKGATNLLELHEILSDKLFVRQKADCIDLPPKTRILTIAEPSEEEQNVFSQAFAALRERYLARVRAGVVRGNSEALVILSQMRHAASWAKVSTVTRIVIELAEENRPAVIFMNYRDSAEALRKAVSEVCPTTLLTSDVPPNERDRRIQAFQNGQYKAIVCTYGTGGVGITLTASTDVILADRPWTPGEAIQAEDRVHRIGTPSPVTAIWIQQHRIDEAIDSILLEKQLNVTEVLLGRRDTIEFGETIEAQAEAILSAIFEARTDT